MSIVNNTNIKRSIGLIVLATAATMGNVAAAAMTQDIEPKRIDLGQAAQLTLSASDRDAESISPPMVEGLEFVAVAQAQSTESINGVSHSTTSVTYQVIPRHVGVFTIPSAISSASPVVLTVDDAGASPQASMRAPGGNPSQAGAGSAFVRLRFPKHDLYVGETVPVDIQVATRDGMVAALNGQPTLNGDAFTLDKLTAQPERTAEVIDGNPFTVFTWHSALAAVKPGRLSLTMETPLTVRVRSELALDDLFNDPSLQSFFGTSTEREVIVASPPANFSVQALPTQGQPADFSGAVGHFTVKSDVSDSKAAAGDPITLRLLVAGSGTFDRVSSPMLHDVAHWKTYAPTATFKAADPIGYRGEKIFDQPVIAMQAGTQALPALAFSWFDPATGRYVDAHTPPLQIDVTPASASESFAHLSPSGRSAPSATGAVAQASTGESNGLRPDHAVTGATVASLRPHYLQAPYVAAPSLMMLAFLSLGFWARRRERRADEISAARETAAALQTGPLLAQMNQAASTNNAELFFSAARQAVQRALASRWHMPPAEVTSDEAEARLGPDTDVCLLFELADEARYSKKQLTALDIKHWTQVVNRQIKGENA